VTLLQLAEFGAAVVVILSFIGGGVTLIWRKRLNVAVTGKPELLNDGFGRMTESFIFHVRSGRDDPVRIEMFGLYGQDTRGDYRQVIVRDLPLDISRGKPYRQEIPVNHLAEFGIDVRRRIYAYARLADPARVAWSRRLTAGPQPPAMTRSLPRPLGRSVGEPQTRPPWRVRWFK